MKEKNRENKRTIAIVVALGILLLSAFGNMFLDKFKISRLENQLNEEEWADYFSELSSKDQIIQGTDLENRIAVLSIDGIIGADNVPTWDNLLDASSAEINLDYILEDPTIKGLILNVNSPGGGVYDSAKIWSKIKEIQDKTDIVIYTSMGEVAASGGYYVAAPSEKIFAAEETLTGSIGVISDYINIAELEEKIGIRHEVIKSGEHKDIGSASREMTDEEREINQKQVDDFFDKFVDVIVDGRNLSEEEVRELADGQVYTGKQAYENGLVDEIGYFEDAIEYMIADLDLDDPQVFEKTTGSSIWTQFLSKAGQIKSENTQGENAYSFETDALNYIHSKRSEGNLPDFYYIHGGF